MRAIRIVQLAIVATTVAACAAQPMRVEVEPPQPVSQPELLDALHQHILAQDWTIDYWDADAGIIEAVSSATGNSELRTRNRWVFHIDGTEVESSRLSEARLLDSPWLTVEVVDNMALARR